VADKPGDADEAKANEANKAEAYEADAEVNEAVEAIVTKEIESNVIDEIVAADEAIVIDEVIAVNEAILIGKVIAVDEAILDDAANEAIVANEADDSDDEADGVLDNQLAELEKKDVEVSKITVHLCCCWQPFSLTKYCAIFSKDKGYFCPIANNNQLGGGAIGVDFAIMFDETIVIVKIVSANEAIAIDRAIAVDRANTANEANEASLAEVNELLAYGGIAVVVKYSSKLLNLLPFSLTKKIKIFAEVEGYFGLIFINQPAEMIVGEMGHSSLSKGICGLEVVFLVEQLDLPP
jgi:hypothetical protein